MGGRDNLDYEKTISGFRWQDVYEQLDWLPEGRLNIAHEAIDRHAAGPLRDSVALIWIGGDGEREEYTFGELAELTSRFANVLRSLGVELGDRICICLGRLPELYVAFLGTLKTGAIVVPLPAGSGMEAIKGRMLDTRAKVLVTQPETRRSIYTAVFEMFDLQHIVVVNKDHRDPLPMETADLDYEEEMGKAPADFAIAATGQYDHSTIHYTGGTPGVVHAHLAVAQHLAAATWVLDVHDGDLLWSLADPASPAGTAYGVFAPWTIGARLLVYEDDVDPAACYAAVEKHGVSVLHAPARAIEGFRDHGESPTADHDLTSLRHIVTDGGPLPADVVEWTATELGSPVHETWLQAETGTAVVANSPALGGRQGTAGRAVPGVEIDILGDDSRGLAAGVEGMLAVRPGWQSMFRAYWGDSRRYAATFQRGWYVTGVKAKLDDDGYVWLADQ